MNVYERFCRYMGSRKRRTLSREAVPSAIKVSEEVDEINLLDVIQGLYISLSSLLFHCVFVSFLSRY